MIELILRVQIVSFRQPATEYQLPRRFDLVHPPEQRIIRRGLDDLGRGLCFLGDLDQGVGEGV